MLLSHDAGTCKAQLAQLSRQTTMAIHEKIVSLLPEVQSFARHTRLPLVELAMPALRSLRPEEFQQFIRTLKWLIESDRQIDLFEFVLQKIIRRHLEPHFTRARPAAIQYYSIKPLIPDCSVLLSALAQIGSADGGKIEHAFRQGAPYLRATDGGIPLLPRAQCGLAQIDAALNRLTLAVPQIKKNLIEACVHVVGADGMIHEPEAELLRAIADTLDCPIPPFVQVE